MKKSPQGKAKSAKVSPNKKVKASQGKGVREKVRHHHSILDEA
jgi:hypothetical protein